MQVLIISPFRSNARVGFNGRKGLVKLIYNTSSVFLNSHKDTVFYHNKRYWIQ